LLVHDDEKGLGYEPEKKKPKTDRSSQPDSPMSDNSGRIGGVSPTTVRANAPQGMLQLTSLRAAIYAKAIFRTQGSNYESQRVPSDQLLSFLQAKVSEQVGRMNSVDSFDYLQQHIIGAIPSNNEFNQIKSRLATRYGGTCRVSNTYLQVKYPSSTKLPTRADTKDKKLIGLIQVQSYLMVYLLRIANNNIKRFNQEMETLIERFETKNIDQQNKMVCAHLCKKICYSPGHVLITNHSMNKKHDYCAGWWIVNKNPVCFCTCDNDKCLAPGQFFNAIQFRAALERAVAGLIDPNL